MDGCTVDHPSWDWRHRPILGRQQYLPNNRRLNHPSWCNQSGLVSKMGMGSLHDAIMCLDRHSGADRRSTRFGGRCPSTRSQQVGDWLQWVDAKHWCACGKWVPVTGRALGRAAIWPTVAGLVHNATRRCRGSGRCAGNVRAVDTPAFTRSPSRARVVPRRSPARPARVRCGWWSGAPWGGAGASLILSLRPVHALGEAVPTLCHYLATLVCVSLIAYVFPALPRLVPPKPALSSSFSLLCTPAVGPSSRVVSIPNVPRRPAWSPMQPWSGTPPDRQEAPTGSWCGASTPRDCPKTRSGCSGCSRTARCWRGSWLGLACSRPSTSRPA